VTAAEFWRAAERNACGHALAAEHGGRVEHADAWHEEAAECAREATAAEAAERARADAAAQLEIGGAP
jgi:hypothetical protein